MRKGKKKATKVRAPRASGVIEYRRRLKRDTYIGIAIALLGIIAAFVMTLASGSSILAAPALLSVAIMAFTFVLAFVYVIRAYSAYLYVRIVDTVSKLVHGASSGVPGQAAVGTPLPAPSLPQMPAARPTPPVMQAAQARMASAVPPPSDMSMQRGVEAAQPRPQSQPQPQLPQQQPIPQPPQVPPQIPQQVAGKKRCPYCGRELPFGDIHTICPYCGRRLK